MKRFFMCKICNFNLMTQSQQQWAGKWTTDASVESPLSAANQQLFNTFALCSAQKRLLTQVQVFSFFFSNESVTLAECEEDGSKWITVWHDKTRSRSTVESIKVVQIRATISTRSKQKKDFELTLFYRVEIRTTRTPQERSMEREWAKEKWKSRKFNSSTLLRASAQSTHRWEIESFSFITLTRAAKFQHEERKEREKGEKWAFDLIASWHEPAFNPSGLWTCDEEKHRIIHFFSSRELKKIKTQLWQLL